MSPAHNGGPSSTVNDSQRVIDMITEAQTKIITVSFDKAAAYTTIIVFGGYAGFFATWQLTREYLSKEQALWSALLIMASLLSFVLFEVYKMVRVTMQVLRRAKVIQDPQVQKDANRLMAALAELDALQTSSQRPMMTVWAASVSACVVTALAAVAILAYALILGLAR